MAGADAFAGAGAVAGTAIAIIIDLGDSAMCMPAWTDGNSVCDQIVFYTFWVLLAGYSLVNLAPS